MTYSILHEITIDQPNLRMSTQNWIWLYTLTTKYITFSLYSTQYFILQYSHHHFYLRDVVMRLVEEYQAATRPDYISWDPTHSSVPSIPPKPIVRKTTCIL